MFLPSPPMTNTNDNNKNNNISKPQHTTNISNDTSPPVKRKVGRPGRKRIDTEAKNKRTQQNRAAQRAYRERKENKLKNLENKIHWLEKLNLQNVKESEFVLNGVERLINELNKYRPSNAEDNHLLDFLNQSGQIKSEINSELLKVEGDVTTTPTTASPTAVAATSVVPPTKDNNKESSNTVKSENNNPSPVTSFSSTPSNIHNSANNNNNNNNNILDNTVWSGLLLKKQDTSVPDFNNTWDSNVSSIPLSNDKLPTTNNNSNNIWDSIPLQIDTIQTNSFDFNNTYELNTNTNITDNNVLNSLAFPDIWGEPSMNINNNNNNITTISNSPVVSTTTTIPNMDLPFDCTCGGACFTSPSTKKCDSDCESDDDDTNSIHCDILTRHLINHESIQSVLNDRTFLENEASHCSHFINNVKLQNQLKSYDTTTNNDNNKSFESIVENLCNELMVKCKHDPIQNSIVLKKKDLRKAMLNV